MTEPDFILQLVNLAVVCEHAGIIEVVRDAEGRIDRLRVTNEGADSLAAQTIARLNKQSGAA